MYLNVDYKAIVIKIRHAVLKIFEQLYQIFEQLFQILATFEQLFGIFLSNFLPFSEQNLNAPNWNPQRKMGVATHFFETTSFDHQKKKKKIADISIFLKKEEKDIFSQISLEFEFVHTNSNIKTIFGMFLVTKLL